MRTILVIDDDAKVQSLLSRYLSPLGFHVEGLLDPKLALEKIAKCDPILVLLDRVFPAYDGLEVLSLIRGDRLWGWVPVILVSGVAGSIHRSLGLQLGADDYIEKPFSLMELSARIEAVLRRGRPTTKFSDGTLEVIASERSVSLKGLPVVLSSNEWSALLQLLEMRRPVSRVDIGRRIWGADGEFSFRSVDTVIMRLRKKIEPFPDRPRYILSAHKKGYCFRKD